MKKTILRLIKKIIFIVLFLFAIVFMVQYYFDHGGEKGNLTINVGSEVQEATIKSDWVLTTKVTLDLQGACNCEIKVIIPKADEFHLNKGDISIVKIYEWYSEPMKLKFIPVNCNKESKLNIGYHFTHDWL